MSGWKKSTARMVAWIGVICRNPSEDNATMTALHEVAVSILLCRLGILVLITALWLLGFLRLDVAGS